MRVLRQFRVTDPATGLRTFVNLPYHNSAHRQAAIRAGYTYAAYTRRVVIVTLVRPGFERPLPFDTLPLVIRRRVRTNTNGVATS